MKNISIPQPKAKIGETVLVYNYRKKHNNWETGKVAGAEYHLNSNHKYSYWHYRIITDRQTAKKTYTGKILYYHPMILYVTNEQIKSIRKSSL